MLAIAPNLTTMVGELVGARLIAHAGLCMFAEQGGQRSYAQGMLTKGVLIDCRVLDESGQAPFIHGANPGSREGIV